MTLTYDANAQIDSVTLPDFREESASQLAEGSRSGEFGGVSDVLDVVMDGRGQLLSVTKVYPDGPGTTQYSYDANGNRLSIVDPRNQVMSFEYDTLGRMLTYTDKPYGPPDPAGVVRETDYGPFGQVAQTREGGEVSAAMVLGNLAFVVVGPFAPSPLRAHEPARDLRPPRKPGDGSWAV